MMPGMRCWLMASALIGWTSARQLCGWGWTTSTNFGPNTTGRLKKTDA